MFTILLSALLIGGIKPATDDGIKMSGPKQVMTTKQIVAHAKKDDVQGGLRTKPRVNSAEYNAAGRSFFVAWFSPYSGRAACHIYLYEYDAEQKIWIRKVAEMIKGTPTISVELGDSIAVRDFSGKVVKRYKTDD